MNNQCPKCRSTQIEERNLGKKVGGIAGTIIGGISGGAAVQVVGDILDEELLGHYRCLACGHTFNDGLASEMLADE